MRTAPGSHKQYRRGRERENQLNLIYCVLIFKLHVAFPVLQSINNKFFPIFFINFSCGLIHFTDSAANRWFQFTTHSFHNVFLVSGFGNFAVLSFTWRRLISFHFIFSCGICFYCPNSKEERKKTLLNSIFFTFFFHFNFLKFPNLEKIQNFRHFFPEK